MNDDLKKLRDELAELSAKATPGPWGWTNHGEKCNCAVLGLWYNRSGEPLAGHVEEEVYDGETGDYRRVADFGDSIAYKDDNANYSDFALLAALRNSLPRLLACLDEVVAGRKAVLAARGRSGGSVYMIPKAEFMAMKDARTHTDSTLAGKEGNDG